MLRTVLASLLLTACVTAAPLSSTAPDPGYPAGPILRDHVETVFDSPVVQPDSRLSDGGADAHVNANAVGKKRAKAAGGVASPRGKKSVQDNRKKPVSAASDAADTPADADPKTPKAPEQGVAKTPPNDDSSPTGNADEGNTKSSPSGAETGDGVPPAETDSKTPPTGDGDPKPATDPAKRGEEKPPASDSAQSGAAESSVPDSPKDTNTSETGEKPGFAADGEAPMDSELPPAGVIGGAIAGVALLAAAFVVWSRRNTDPPQVYEPVQGEDADADGWNEGWDDGWEEDASTKA